MAVYRAVLASELEVARQAKLSGGGRLPAQPTRLIGRAEEVAAVRRLLRQPAVRLVTLTGPGGVGKTRLALQVAAELADELADGVFFVPLAPLGDPALVGPAIAQAVALREQAGRSLLDDLKSFLWSRHLLLVLDNFEHLAEAGPLVAELVADCPLLEVLVTSRATLRLSGEHELPVRPLALPDVDALPETESLAGYPAVELLLERAAAVRPDFRLTSDNAAAIAAICARLDGLPLAIELAAARLKLLSEQEILARLEQPLELLTVGARDLPPRQRTLRETIAWSCDLLDARERRLFRRLAVFAGGFTLETAEAVAGEPGVLDVLASLLDKSLLQRTPEAGAASRFEMLETIRRYALEQLAASGEDSEARAAHAGWSVDLGDQGGGKAPAPGGR